MKKLFTSACALMAVTFALAQGNVDVTTQVGNLNTATVDQTGWLNQNYLLRV